MIPRYSCKHFFGRKILYFLIISVLASSAKNSRTLKITRKILKPSILHREGEYFTNTWAVRIPGGLRKAEGVAKRMGYDLQKRISEGFPDIYLFRHPKYPNRTKYAGESVTKQLNKHSEIIWTEQQIAEAGDVRKFYSVGVRSTTEKRKTGPTILSWPNPTEALQCPVSENPNDTRLKRSLNLNDEYWPRQTYIKDCHEGNNEPPRDLNLAPVWVKHGLLGKNIKVIVVDDGMDTKHADLADNYDSNLGLDLQDNDKTPDPVSLLFRRYAHGTSCAGVIGMKANNSICGVGIAPSVTLGAVRLLGMKSLTDYNIGTALLFRHVKSHIMSNSWGPKDNGSIMPYSGPLARTALKIGITKGREGKGIIYVFAAGNGKKRGDNCGCDPLVSSIYSIAVATCSNRGKVTAFSERCASIMVTTYPGNVAPDAGGLGKQCVTDFGGTSASTPMVAGAIALTLEANPNLFWRDVQHLLAWTCQIAPLQKNPVGTWTKNGAGFYVSHDFGFGMLNINNLVEMAKNFRNVGAMNTCVTTRTQNEAGDAGETFCDRLKVEITTDGCEGTPSEVAYLEHVQVTVSLGFPRRGDLKIDLLSPSGTNARLLDVRPHDSYENGIQYWAFDSVLTWGESPKGTWTVFITGKKRKDGCTDFKGSVRSFWKSKNKNDTTRKSICYPTDDHAELDKTVHVGELNDLTLTFHGTSKSEMPEHYKSGPRSYDHFNLPK